ncbi:hypothetical protein CXX84_11575 [Arthrobacter sp. AFG7.2]|uniref:hypothetical protein n=1 Tax=Arthrobacter sp. AFG7.2 TaxID=1688693 RepID=UPI000C9E64D2|nr:hypothetical protein [Arthrobacter sp. AFG7.2]PNI08538.1 hypothetical protein CXX84_11575 [Arthrobacter sp. AFG7.2]
MGNSGKFAVIAGIVAAGLLVLTGMTLAEPVFVALLGVLALAYLACLMEILNRGRRLALLAAGAGTSLTVAFLLAFVSTWELAFAGESSFLGTPLPTGDPDNYFFGAAAAGLATLLVLFLGAVWPPGRRLRSSSGKNRAGKGRPGKGRAGMTAPANRGTTTGRAGAGGTAQRRPARRPAGEGTSRLRAPARAPSVPAKRPSSSPAASQGRTPPSTTGTRSTRRR